MRAGRVVASGCRRNIVQGCLESEPAMRRLKKRYQFLNTARGTRFSGRFFVLQSNSIETNDCGIGYTVTKRTGNSPERNRIKRRLRAAVLACKNRFENQREYVLIGRRDALNAPFCDLVQKLEHALRHTHRQTHTG